MADVLIERRGPVLWVTFNRPERRNAWTAESFVLLADAWQQLQEDRMLRVAVLTGAGEQAFTAGGDLAELIPLFTGMRQPQSALEKRFMAEGDLSDRALLKTSQVTKPIIAAVNGAAMGGGCEILQGCDIRLAVPDARFGLPEAKRAIVPGGGSMVRLIRQLPYPLAMEMMLTGEPVDASRALQYGFINRIVPADVLLQEAERVALQIASNGPLAIQAIKSCALRTEGLPLEEAYAIERELSAQIMMSRDAQEGPRAFMEKRTPEYRGE